MFKKHKSDLFVIFSCLIFTLVNGNYDNVRLVSDNDVAVNNSRQWVNINSCYDTEECDSDLHEVCDKSTLTCVCSPFYERTEHNHCELCPDEGRSCSSSCCSSYRLECVDGKCVRCYEDDNGVVCNSQSTIFFITASQIALSTALVMGIIALITLLYRLCAKPTYNSQRRTPGAITDDPNIERTNSFRASLTSIQVRVMARLRDRPPRYETRHNYDHFNNERRTTEGNNIEQTNTIENGTTQHTNGINAIPGEAPPAYDGSRDLVGELPPPYTIAITQGQPTLDITINNNNYGIINETTITTTTTNGNQNTENSGTSQGLINLGYINTETGQQPQQQQQQQQQQSLPILTTTTTTITINNNNKINNCNNINNNNSNKDIILKTNNIDKNNLPDVDKTIHI